MTMLLTPLTALAADSPSAASAPGIPIKAVILVNDSFDSTNSHSELFLNVKRVLELNKIPYDTLDSPDISEKALLGSSGLPRYAVAIDLAPGWLLKESQSSAIINASREGMGLVGLLPDVVNEDINILFGIAADGRKWQNASVINFKEDLFTFSYQSENLTGDFAYLDHQLSKDAKVIATFKESKAPAIWTYRNGKGKSVFHDHASALIYQYRGLLLQSILYAMPVGIACPIAAGAIEVDDCPAPYYNEDILHRDYREFYSNFKEWLQSFHFKASFFTTFSYSGNTSDFWFTPESMACAADILKEGYELGIHNGSNHFPLSPEYWGSDNAVSAEIDTMADAWKRLQQGLDEKYGVKLGGCTSYSAPQNVIGDAAYKLLAQKMGIKYVGTSSITNEVQRSGIVSTVVGFKPALKEFGWEGNTGIFNVPRMKGSFFEFDDPKNLNYTSSWEMLRSVIESGDAYTIMTHAHESTLVSEGAPTGTDMPVVFESYWNWADYVTEHYPFYRWLTASELGNYISQRKGTIEAWWYPGKSTLQVKLSQPEDVLQIKMDKYIKSISGTGNSLTIEFSNLPQDIDLKGYETLTCGSDLFIYPEDAASSLPRPAPGFFVFHTIPRPTPTPSVAPAPIPQLPAAKSSEQPVVKQPEATTVKGLPRLALESGGAAGLLAMMCLLFVYKLSRR